MSIAGSLPGQDDIPAAALRALSRTPHSPVLLSHGAVISLGVCDDSVAFRDGESLLLLDGRIDNYPEIARALGCSGENYSVILFNAWRKWGLDFPARLHGDFALAAWDGATRRLILARDPGGYRPLHYWAQGDRFRFATEARGLLAPGDIPLAVSQHRIAHWLARLPESSGATFFDNIFSVPPGHTLLYERGRTRLHDHWKPERIAVTRLSNPLEYAEGLKCVLQKAVADRIGSSVRAGSHLSGGLDSSAITALAATHQARRGAALTAFTAVPSGPVDDSCFPRRFGDESSHAAATAALYPNAGHVLIPTNSFPILETLDLMSSAAEAPQLNPGNSVWLYAICHEAARRGIDVLLTGANGNFTISYDGRRAASELLRRGRVAECARLVSALHRNGAAPRTLVRTTLWPLLPSFARGSLALLRRSPALKVEDATGLRPEFARSLGISPREALENAEGLDGRSLRIWSMRRNDYGGHISAFRRLTGVIQTDPTADRRVMEFCLSVPEEQYVAGGRSRSLIRNALGSLLPAMVLGETRIGRQSADLVVQMSREREGIASEVRRMRESPLASRCLNVPLLQTLVETWPGYGPGSGERKVQDQYGMLLMRGVSMGRFIRRVEEGSLFRGDMVSRDLISSGPRMSRNEVLRASQPLPEETPA